MLDLVRVASQTDQEESQASLMDLEVHQEVVERVASLEASRYEVVTLNIFGS